MMSVVYIIILLCHLADLTIKAGMKILPVDIDHDQFFVDVFYFFFHSSK